ARLQVSRGELRTVVVRLRDWAVGSKVVLTTPGATIRGERTAGGERVWTLDLPPGVTKEYEFTISGKDSREEAAGGMWAPDVIVTPMSYDDGIHPAHRPAGASDDRWLVVGQNGLGHESPRTLEAVGDVPKLLADWPGAAALKTGSALAAWKLPAAEP